jgi:transcriptional regulator with XRE-family HTH domain
MKKLTTQERLAALQRWLAEYVTLHQTTVTGISNQLGKSHSSLTRIANGELSKLPRLETLIELADYTGTDIRTLAAIIAPDLVQSGDPELAVIMQDLRRLPKDKRKIIHSFIKGVLADEREDTG